MITVYTGLMRVKNEARWIERCIRSMFPACGRVFVMDDHSTDGTAEICASISGVTFLHSPFDGLDEKRDKNWMLEQSGAAGWVLMIDGDEMLSPGTEIELARGILSGAPALSLPVHYLWDSETQVRMDGVYGRFWRPSAFRVTPGLRFESTSAGGNFHCGNVPMALQLAAEKINAPLLHFGYMHQADRVRKYGWYNEQDPGNRNEDGYRHMVIGDLFPAESRFMHAGPLRLEAVCSLT